MSSMSLMALCVRMEVSKPAERGRIESREVKAMLGIVSRQVPWAPGKGEANEHAVLMSEQFVHVSIRITTCYIHYINISLWFNNMKPYFYILYEPCVGIVKNLHLFSISMLSKNNNWVIKGFTFIMFYSFGSIHWDYGFHCIHWFFMSR